MAVGVPGRQCTPGSGDRQHRGTVEDLTDAAADRRSGQEADVQQKVTQPRRGDPAAEVAFDALA